jgi:xyloglucan-specific endo-beta-1,4-glucanase
LVVVLSAIPCVVVHEIFTLNHVLKLTIHTDWDLIQTGPYTLYNNLWGKGAATSGSQCTTLDKVSGSVLSWHSAWSWTGGQYNVKSYPNTVVETKDVPLSKVKSIETTWKWNYAGAGLVTNVAYDLFTSSTIGGSEEYELMIWLGNFNAGPIARLV